MESEAGPSTSDPSRRRRRNIFQPQQGSDWVPFTSPPAKRRKNILSSGERHLIVNIFKYVTKSKAEDKYVSNHDLVKQTSEISGVSERSIYIVLNEYRNTHKIKEPEKKRNRPTVIQKIDDFDKSAIRKIVHGFFFKGELPTLKKVQQAVNADESLPTVSLTSLRRVLKHLKFKYMKRNRKSLLIDRGDIVLWRIKYLKQMKQFREENRRIFYTDETWVNAGHTVGKTWVDENVKTAKQAFKEGVSIGAKNPVSKGKRLIVVHVGNEEGFLDDCQWVFEAKKSGEYHENMDAPHFKQWFQKVLTKMKPGDVIVLDNASYHSRRMEQTPTMNWRKGDIQDWLRSKNISFDDGNYKKELMEKVNAVKKNFQSFVIDEMAKKKGVTVLRLPPYHCELNPIELIWADIKGYVARHNTTFNFKDLNKLLEDGIQQVTREKWANCVEHVKKEEINMCNLDHTIDKTVDKFIINVTDDTSESSEYTSSCDDEISN